MKLIALLPKDRTKLGTLQVWHNDALLESFQVLGKADNAQAVAKGNPTRDPMKQFGDTPIGVWRVDAGIIRREVDTYGPHRVFMLWPLSGPALKAYASPARRSGIWLHGGKLNSKGLLRPTYGCLRVHNETMARLHELIAQYGKFETLETKEA